MAKLFTNTSVPTGFYFYDILCGRNIRDLKGNLITAERGFSLSKQYSIAAAQGTGKSTAIIQMLQGQLDAGYPLEKVFIFDTDNSQDYYRLQYLLERPIEFVTEKIQLIEGNVLEDIPRTLKKASDEYKARKPKPVEITNIYTGEKQSMMPYHIVVVDTYTALKCEDYDVNASDALAVAQNQSHLQKNLKMDNIINSIENYFDGNIVVIWVTHLKTAMAMGNQTVPESEFKASGNSKKSTASEALKRKCSQMERWSSLDTANTESGKHPINLYGLKYAKDHSSVYGASVMTVKNRTCKEGMTKIVFLNVDSKFDKEASMIATAKDLNIIEKAGGQFPSADKQSIFKGTGSDEEKLMGRYRMEAYKLEGYDKVFNLMEAILLMKYLGDNEEIYTARDEFITALMAKSEKELSYELEVNNITEDQMDKSKNRRMNIFSLASKINRNEVSLPETKDLEDDVLTE